MTISWSDPGNVFGARTLGGIRKRKKAAFVSSLGTTASGAQSMKIKLKYLASVVSRN